MNSDAGRHTGAHLFASQVTQDGEHPNGPGTVIEASLFAAQINEWALSADLCAPPTDHQGTH